MDGMATIPLAGIAVSEFGHIMREIRLSLGLSQAACAARIGSTQRHISFLETGRSAPSATFLGRICQELELSIAQRTNLFESAGQRTPYPRRDPASNDIQATLDMLEQHVLGNWPFPAMVLDENWTVLRKNAAFERIFGPFLPARNDRAANLFDLLLHEIFRSMITNWDEAISVLFFRLQRAAAQNPELARRYQAARERGLFENIAQDLVSGARVPVHTPICMTMPGGLNLEFFSVMGRVPSLQDAVLERYEVEFIVPADPASEAALRAMSKGAA